MKSWLENNSIEMYSIHNVGKSVVAEKFFRTLKNKIYKHMTSVSKNMYIDKLDDLVNKYIHTYHTNINMKPVDVKPRKILNQTIKIFLPKAMFQIGLKSFCD